MNGILQGLWKERGAFYTKPQLHATRVQFGGDYCTRKPRRDKNENNRGSYFVILCCFSDE